MTDVINAALHFARDHANVLGMSLLYAIPFLILSGIINALVITEFLTDLTLVAQVFALIGNVFTVALTLGVVRQYERHGSEDWDASDVFGWAKSYFGAVVLLNMMYGLLLIIPALLVGGMLGFMVAFASETAGFVVGGLAAGVWLIYAMLAYYVALPIRVLEDKDFANAFSRSNTLVKGYFGPTLGVLVLSIAVYLIALMATVVPAGLMGFGAGWLGMEGTGLAVVVSIGGVLEALGVALAVAVSTLIAAMHYYNLVERQEQEGLKQQVAGMERSLAESEGNGVHVAPSAQAAAADKPSNETAASAHEPEQATGEPPSTTGPDVDVSEAQRPDAESDAPARA